MRTNQVTLRVESFDQEKPIQFSIYADSDSLYETLIRVTHALYERLGKEIELDSYEEFINTLHNKPLTYDDNGVCKVYENVHKANHVLEGVEEI